MKKQLGVLVAMIMLTGLTLAADKIGYVNPADILQNSIKGKEVVSRLKSLSDNNQKKLDAMQAELDKLQKEAMSPALTADVREKKAVEIQNKRTSITRFVEDAQKTMELSRQKEFDKLQQEINPIIQQIAVAEGYTMVFDVSQTGIAYANPQADITPKVIKAFDAKYVSAGTKK